MDHKPSSTSVLLGARTPVLLIASLLCFVIAPAVSASTSTQLFFDDFTGTALDTSLWSIFVDSNGEYHWPYVAGGLLYSQGYHTRIDSIPTFAPMGQSVVARARIRLAGADQKFGFAVNPNEHAGPVTGYYFDIEELENEGGRGREGYIRALAWSNPGDGSLINLLDVEIPVTWYEFHEFAVERTPSEVIYSIDGQEVTRVADAFADALPVGVWNDRWGLMQTDWVEVSQITSATIDATVSIDPDTLNLESKGKYITCYITLPEGYDVSDVDPATILLNEQIAAARSMVNEEESVLTIKFDRAAVEELVQPGEAELLVTGAMIDGTLFSGTDTILVIDPTNP